MKKNIDPHRKLTKKDFEGKTIQSVDVQACNIIYFTFTDGTRLAIEAEVQWPGIPTMEACEPCAEEHFCKV